MNSETGHRIPLDTTGEPPSLPPPVVPPADAPPLAQLLTAEQVTDVQEQIIAALKTCYDPEVPVNIYEMGLIYAIDVQPTGAVGIRMTLTSPACPVAGSLPPEVQAKARAVANVTAVKVDLVWDPPWEPSRMSDAARLKLGIDW